MHSLIHYYPEFLKETITNPITANCIFLGYYHFRNLNKGMDDEYEYFEVMLEKKIQKSCYFGAS